jgi:hypothetical protein
MIGFINTSIPSRLFTINYSPTASQPTSQITNTCSVLVLCWTLLSLYSQLSYQSKYKSYVTIDGQSASLSWNKALIWGSRPEFYYYQTGAVSLMWDALSDERADLSFPRVTAVIGVLSVCTIYILHVIKCIYNIQKASVSPDWVEQTIPYSL